MNNFPKISIVIPVFNVAEYIESCIYSVLNQSYSNLECLIVDDCTEDNSMALVRNIISNYNGNISFSLIEHLKNSGLSAARNSGVKMATGEYLYFLDSDDEIFPHTIESLVKTAIAYSNPDIVIGEVCVQGTKIGYPLFIPDYMNSNEQIFTSYLNKEWWIMACNKLVKYSYFINNALWFKEGLIYEDRLWSFQVALTANTIAKCSKGTYIYKIRKTGSITSSNGCVKYDNYLFILEQKCRFIIENKLFERALPVGDCIIDFAYCILVGMVQDGLNRKQLFDYCRRIEKCINCVVAYNVNSDSINIVLKKMLLKLPFLLCVFVIKMHNIIVILRKSRKK